MEKQRILIVMRIIWILVLTVFMASCTSITQPEAPPAAPKATWADRQARLDRIQSWRINGKIAVQTAKDSGSASINWAQNQRSYNISLLGPLGSHGMNLSGQPGHVVMQMDGKSYSSSSPEQLLATRWGFNLPVSNMRYWIRGIPVPGIPAQTQFDRYGRLTNLVQQGWNIQFLGYSNQGGVDLPARLSITSSSLRAKVIVYQWSV